MCDSRQPDDGAGSAPAVEATRVTISKQTIWGGNGFGSRTEWTAVLDGQVVGRWCRRDLFAWAGDDRRATFAFPLPEWKRVARALGQS